MCTTPLRHKTQYWYKSYVKLDDQSFYGEVKTFTTDVVPVESVSLDKTEHTFHAIGNTLTLNATVLPSDATDKSVEWSSDKEDVATVDASGKVTAQGNGKATITVTTKDQGKTATCVITVAQWVTSINLNQTSLTLNEGQGQTLTATINPSNANDPSITWTSSDESVAKVDQTGKVTAISKGTATIRATANDGSLVYAACSVRVYKVPDAVDLGIVVNGKTVKWATFNLGASSPEEYGHYYAWGETETKEYYSWSTYKFGTSSSGPFSKYNTNSSYGAIDNKTVLEPEDDVAHVILGGKWRMPTDAEWTALRTNCTWTWTTNYNGTGVAGRIVTSNVEGYKDKSIFLPAAGYRDGTYLYSAGSYGNYWSSSLNTDYPNDAWRVYFDSSRVYGYNYYRCYGQSVRPVSE